MTVRVIKASRKRLFAFLTQDSGRPVLKYILLPLFIITAGLFFSCTGGQMSIGTIHVRFAVIGNTYPASPFIGKSENLRYVFQSINRDNPLICIHTGNIINGGNSDKGIRREDIVRQFRDFERQKRTLDPLLYTVAGTRDRFNGSLFYYEKYTEKSLNYSFNIGRIHFIVFNTIDSNDVPTPGDLSWLEADLHRFRSAQAIFLLTHIPLMGPRRSGIRHPAARQIHSLIKRFPVRAVISGGKKKFYETEKDSIRYITAGCFGFTREAPYWYYNQYYLCDYNGTSLTVTPRKGDIPKNSYRPKIIIAPPEKK